MNVDVNYSLNSSLGSVYSMQLHKSFYDVATFRNCPIS